MSKSIDRKFKINATSISSGKSYDETTAVLFLARDKGFLKTLPHYLAACIEVGADEHQIRAVELMTERVAAYQRDHPGEAKVPDVDPVVEAACLQP